MKFTLVVIASAILLSCSNNTEKTKTYSTVAAENTANADSAAIEKVKANSETVACYTNQKNKDSVFLQINTNNNIVNGNLYYQLVGKDKNNGTLQGEMRGDTLFADYNFMSEGTQSIRQVAYLKKDNSLLEGYGDVEDKGNKMVFKNTGKLTFGKGVVLQKTGCNK